MTASDGKPKGGRKARDVSEILRNFDSLPGSAVIPRRVAALLLGVSARTMRRNPPFPSVAITQNLVGHRVADIRAQLAKNESLVAALAPEAA
jgi:hypothetical protein